MAKRERSSDKTVAASLDGGQTVAASLGGGQTTAMPNTRPTDKVELAWSSGDVFGGPEIPDTPQDVEEEPRVAVVGQSWGATLRIAALLVAAGLVLAGAIMLGRWALSSGSSPTKAAPAPGATSTAAEASGPAASATGGGATPTSITPEQDDRYIQTLNDKGITFDSRENAIINGKQVCQDLSKGVPKSQEVEAFRKQVLQNNPTLAARAAEYVDISISAYCPQYAR